MLGFKQVNNDRILVLFEAMPQTLNLVIQALSWWRKLETMDAVFRTCQVTKRSAQGHISYNAWSTRVVLCNSGLCAFCRRREKDSNTIPLFTSTMTAFLSYLKPCTTLLTWLSRLCLDEGNLWQWMDAVLRTCQVTKRSAQGHISYNAWSTRVVLLCNSGICAFCRREQEDATLSLWNPLG